MHQNPAALAVSVVSSGCGLFFSSCCHCCSSLLGFSYVLYPSHFLYHCCVTGEEDSDLTYAVCCLSPVLDFSLLISHFITSCVWPC